MPSRPNTDMARAKECTITHRVVVTDERTLGGWSSPRTTKQIPATRADKPAQRMRLDAVIFISLLPLTTVVWRFAFMSLSPFLANWRPPWLREREAPRLPAERQAQAYATSRHTRR